MLKLKQDVVASDCDDDGVVVDDLIIVSGRVFVSRSSASLQAPLTSAHDTGHEGTHKMLHRPHVDFQVPGVRLCPGVRRLPAE
jgi:hypothetical protein